MKIYLKDFSYTPGGRKISQGPFSGEKFLFEFLLPAIKTCREKREILEIELSHTAGVADCFLSESFGRLFWETDLTFEELNKILIISFEEEPERLSSVWEIIEFPYKHFSSDVE